MIADASTPAVVLKLFHQCGLGVVRSLGRCGVPVYGVHDDRRGSVARSRYLREVLEVNIDDAPREHAVERMVEFARTRIGRPALLIATDDVGSNFIEASADALREHFTFPPQPEGLVRRLYDKKQLYLLCKEIGIDTAETQFPKSRADVERMIEGATFPIVLKPIDNWILNKRGKGEMVIAKDRDELLRCYDDYEDPAEPNFMLQEYIPGGAESVWMFNGYFDSGSRCLLSFTGRKLRQHPAYTGMTSLGVCLRNEEVERVTFEFMRKIGYRGVLDIGWRYDERDGVYRVLDVNARVGATFRLFVGRKGMDVVRALYLDLTGQPVPSDEARDGRKWIVENFDVASSLRYARDGELTLRRWLSSFRGVEETAWFARDDPRPFVRMGLQSVRAVVRKLAA